MEATIRVKDNNYIAADILDDLASRFIINVPDDERSNFVRICFQIELAHWFYLDFYCTGEDNKSLTPCGIKQFANHIFNHIPFLSIHIQKLDVILQEWKQYKMTVPTYGAILMTSDLKHVLLVQSYWAKSSWGFPKGKVNENEDPLHCAIREVYEETGFDISKLAKEDEFIEGVLNYQYTRLYLIRNVPIGTVFVPRTRKEIKYCEWFYVDHLPVHKTDQMSKLNLGINANSFFMIMPFVKRLKKWINERLGQQNTTDISSAKKLNYNESGKSSRMASNHEDNNSPKTVFFKNNSTDRQRHKSLGDIECQVIDNAISSQDNRNKMVNLIGQQIFVNSSLNGKQQNYGNLKNHSTNGNRYEDCSAQYKLNKPSAEQQQKVKVGNQFKSINQDINKHRNESNVTKLYNPSVEENMLKKIRKKFSKTENQSTNYGSFNTSQNQMVVFNIPRLAEMLQNEPNIRKWLNVELDKDNIFEESLKML